MKKILVIVGPTAVGKSELAVKLAQKFNGEIISGDSIQVYRGLDIGSGKISLLEQAGVKHHLLDILSFKDNYSVKDFQDKGRQLIEEISNRNKLPILVGGTGLYIKALLYDYVFLEENITDVEKEVVQKMSNLELVSWLEENDPESLRKIHPHNRQRLLRAVIFNRYSTKKKSEVIAKQKQALLYDALMIGLTMDREALYAKINTRVEMMFEQGLKEEVTNLYQKDPQVFTYQSFSGIGYKEWQEYFLGNKSEAEVKSQIQLHSRRFAKRQYTWFLNQMPVIWFEKEAEASIIESVKKWKQDFKE